MSTAGANMLRGSSRDSLLASPALANMSLSFGNHVLSSPVQRWLFMERRRKYMNASILDLVVQAQTYSSA